RLLRLRPHRRRHQVTTTASRRLNRAGASHPPELSTRKLVAGPPGQGTRPTAWSALRRSRLRHRDSTQRGDGGTGWVREGGDGDPPPPSGGGESRAGRESGRCEPAHACRVVPAPPSRTHPVPPPRR